MWQRNECGPRKLPSAAVSYSSAGPPLGTSGRGQNRLEKNGSRGAVSREFFQMEGTNLASGMGLAGPHWPVTLGHQRTLIDCGTTPLAHLSKPR